eukprot:4299850-Karenia_brevis.AAC.1
MSSASRNSGRVRHGVHHEIRIPGQKSTGVDASCSRQQQKWAWTSLNNPTQRNGVAMGQIRAQS